MNNTLFWRIFFIIPIVFDLCFISGIADPEFLYASFIPYHEMIFSLWGFYVGLMITIISFLFIVLYTITKLLKKQTSITYSVQNIYTKNEFIILAALMMPLSTILTLTLLMITPLQMLMPMDMQDSYWLVFINAKLIIMIAICFFAGFTPRYMQKIGRILLITTLLVFSGVIGYVFLAITQDMQPDYYSIYPLDDKKAVYILNFDGDYWITYYHVHTACKNLPDGSKPCHDVYEKLGNSPISSTPVDLKPFVDKHIQVVGEFEKTMGMRTGTDKKICIKNNCQVSKGPGDWVSSPLKISSIKTIK